MTRPCLPEKQPPQDRCPLCGQSNQCVMGEGQADSAQALACWCMNTTISPQALAALAQQHRQTGTPVPLSCLCPACAAGLALHPSSPSSTELP